MGGSYALDRDIKRSVRGIRCDGSANIKAG